MNIISYVLAFAVLQLFQMNRVILVSCQSKNSFNSENRVIKAVEELGRKLSQAQWANDANDNVVLSPLNIMIILNLLILGTNKNTNLELRKALNLPKDFQEEVIHNSFKNILESLPKSEIGVTISLNIKLFLRIRYEITDFFKNGSNNWYFTEIQNLDFRNFPIHAMKEINNWVSNITDGKIVKVLSEPLSPNAVCAVFSVICLNATFKEQFNKNLTKNGTFSTGKENITIPMMISEIKVPYFRDEKAKLEIISLPFERNPYSIYILKPTDNSSINNLQQVEDGLNSTYLYSLIGQMKPQEMLVTLPRMKLSQNLDLQMDLKSLGINKIFSKNSADFKRLSDKQRLFVSHISYKAFFEITEDGTSGAVVGQ